MVVQCNLFKKDFDNILHLFVMIHIKIHIYKMRIKNMEKKISYLVLLKFVKMHMNENNII